jgi:hypothetical protein
MALVGPVSGSNSRNAISGTLIVANSLPGNFPALPSDAVLFVSGAINGTQKAVFGGDVYISGALQSAQGSPAIVAGLDTYIQFNDGGVLGGDAGLRYSKTDDSLSVSGAVSASLGFSGSLTRLLDGRSYLVAGLNATITSESNGQVRIDVSAPSTSPGGATTEIQFNNAGNFGSDNTFYFDSATKTVNFATGSVFNVTASGGIRAPVFQSGLHTLIDAVNVSWDLRSGSFAKLTLGGNRTLSAPTYMTVGASYTLIIQQSAAGNNTLAFDSTYKFPYGGDAVITTSSNAIDIVSFVSDGANMYAAFQQDFR